MYQGMLLTWPQGYLENHPRTRKWLGSPPFTSHLGHLEREQPYLGDLLTMVDINHLLTGMILQVRFANDSMILYKLISKKPDMPWNAMISISSSRISCIMPLVGAFCCHPAPLLFSNRWLLIGVLWPSLDRWRRREFTVGGVQDGPTRTSFKQGPHNSTYRWHV